MSHHRNLFQPPVSNLHQTRCSTRELQRVVVGSRPEKAELHGQT